MCTLEFEKLCPRGQAWQTLLVVINIPGPPSGSQVAHVTSFGQAVIGWDLCCFWPEAVQCQHELFPFSQWPAQLQPSNGSNTLALGTRAMAIRSRVPAQNILIPLLQVPGFPWGGV